MEFYKEKRSLSQTYDAMYIVLQKQKELTYFHIQGYFRMKSSETCFFLPFYYHCCTHTHTSYLFSLFSLSLSISTRFYIYLPLFSATHANIFFVKFGAFNEATRLNGSHKFNFISSESNDYLCRKMQTIELPMRDEHQSKCDAFKHLIRYVVVVVFVYI